MPNLPKRNRRIPASRHCGRDRLAGYLGMRLWGVPTTEKVIVACTIPCPDTKRRAYQRRPRIYRTLVGSTRMARPGQGVQPTRRALYP